MYIPPREMYLKSKVKYKFPIRDPKQALESNFLCCHSFEILMTMIAVSDISLAPL